MDLREAKLSNYNITARHPWELARLEVVLQFLKSIEKDKSAKITILDIGCGDTYVVEKISEYYHNAKFLAIDTAFTDTLIDELNNKFIENNNSIQLFKSIETATNKLQKSVDIVLMLDVLEHIESDTDFLKSMLQNSIIDKNTQFLITVPAYQYLFSSHDEFLGHYRRYNNKSLKKLINNVGLKHNKIGYFFTSLFLIRNLQAIIEKILPPKKNKGIGDWKSNKIKDNILYYMLIIDFKITYLFKKIKIPISGLSNYIICKKSV